MPGKRGYLKLKLQLLFSLPMKGLRRNDDATKTNAGITNILVDKTGVEIGIRITVKTSDKLMQYESFVVLFPGCPSKV